MLVAFLGFVTYQCLFPPASTEAATATANLSAVVEPVLEIAVDTSSLALSYGGQTNITPTAAGVTATGDVNVYVSTNNTAGYTLSIYTNDTTTAMKHSNTNVETAINATAGNVSNLAANTWGFKYGSQPWKPVGASSSNTVTVNDGGTKTSSICNNITTNYASCYAAGSAEKNTVTFGANLTDSLPAGSYTNHVVFSVTPNATRTLLY